MNNNKNSGKEPACQRRRHKRCGFDPWVGKIPCRRAWQPTPLFLLENLTDRRDWRTTEQRVGHDWSDLVTHACWVLKLSLLLLFQKLTVPPNDPPLSRLGLYLEWYQFKKYIYINLELVCTEIAQSNRPEVVKPCCQGTGVHTTFLKSNNSLLFLIHRDS